MFRKLRNRFLLLNLVIISVMMLLAFASIYFITYQNVNRDIEMDLHRSADSYNKPAGRLDAGRLDGDMPRKGPEDRGGDFPPERSLSFSVLTDGEGLVVQTVSPFSMDSSFYQEAAASALSGSRQSGKLSLGGNDWAFIAQAASDGKRLVFLDITARQAILTNLIYTFAAVGLVMLIAIFFISRYFANRSIAPVQEAFDKQKQFIADASHELKTPLTVIQTNTDVLLAHEEDTIGRQAKWLHYIKAETERMGKLTGDLLYLTEMEHARSSLISSAFPASEAAENVILTMEAVIFEKQLALDYAIEPGLTVRGNSEQFRQVVMILLDNAIKYTPTHGSITVSLKRQHADLLLAVSNTGEGIAAEHLERVFDRFYRTDPSRARKRGGHGLGLAIAKAIVEQHKGKIYVKSVLRERTTFYVQLPLAS